MPCAPVLAHAASAPLWQHDESQPQWNVTREFNCDIADCCTERAIYVHQHASHIKQSGGKKHRPKRAGPKIFKTRFWPLPVPSPRTTLHMYANHNALSTCGARLLACRTIIGSSPCTAYMYVVSFWLHTQLQYHSKQQFYARQLDEQGKWARDAGTKQGAAGLRVLTTRHSNTSRQGPKKTTSR